MRFTAKSTRLSLAVVVMLSGLVPLAGAQEEMSAEEQARLAAADNGAAVAQTLALPFVDPFDGNALSASWAVQNENLDKYVLEAGEIFVLENGGTATPDNSEADNIFTLDGELPAGDFTMQISAKLETKTGEESVWIGLREDQDNYIAAQLYAHTKGCGTALYLHVESSRVLVEGEKPTVTQFTSNLFDGPLLNNICSDGPRAIADEALVALFEEGFDLRLTRTGFQYHAGVTLNMPVLGDQPAGAYEFATRRLARTENFGQPFFMLGQFKKAGSGESTALFQEMRIEAGQ